MYIISIKNSYLKLYCLPRTINSPTVMLELWGMRSTPSLPSLPCSLRTGIVIPDRVLSMGQIELNCVLMLNWIVWNRTILTFNCGGTQTILTVNWVIWNRTVWLNWMGWNRNGFWQLNSVLMLNWIVWNRTDYLYKDELGVR